MKFMPGLFGHLPEWQPADRRGDRVDLRPAAAEHLAAEEGIPVRYEFATPEPPKLRFGIAAGRDRDRDRRRRGDDVVDVEAIRGDLEDLKVEQHGRDIVIETRKRFGPRATSSRSASARRTAPTST